MECAHAGGILGVSKLIYIRACVERSVGGGCNIVRWHFVIDLDLVSRPAPAQDNLRSISLAIQMDENKSSSQAQGKTFSIRKLVVSLTQLFLGTVIPPFNVHHPYHGILSVQSERCFSMVEWVLVEHILTHVI